MSQSELVSVGEDGHRLARLHRPADESLRERVLHVLLERAPERLRPIYETVEKVAAQLPETTTFLGFAGSPWTVATYMVAGRGSKDQGEARRFAYADPQAFGEVIDALVDMTGRSRSATPRRWKISSTATARPDFLSDGAS